MYVINVFVCCPKTRFQMCVDCFYLSVMSTRHATDCPFLMEYEFGDLVQLNDQEKLISIHNFKGQQIHLVSGIANPERFHSIFKEHQINVIKHVFPDHYNYSLQDINFNDDYPIVMTEKDAVKCAKFAKDNMWYLPVDVKFNDVFYHRIETLIAENINGQKIT